MALEKFAIWREQADTAMKTTPEPMNPDITKQQETQIGKMAKLSMSNLRDLNDMESFLLEVLKVIMSKTNKDANAVNRVLMRLKTAIKDMGHNI